MHYNKNSAIIGTWTFRRSISDALRKNNYLAQGKLTISPFHWVETGTMNNMPFHQHYYIRMSSTFTILFADGSIFYKLEDIHKPKRITYLCKNDVYNGIWLLKEKMLKLQWNIKGPRKNYRMISTYRKLYEN